VSIRVDVAGTDVRWRALKGIVQPVRSASMIPANKLHLSTPTPALDSLTASGRIDQVTAKDLIAIPAELKARSLAYQFEATGLKVMRDALEDILQKMA
jgi:hypothetical protein